VEKEMKNFSNLLYHDLRLQTRHKNEWAALVLFFFIVILLMPFALGPEPDLLRRLAPGFIWIAALLMSLLALERLFIDDARDGTLDLLLLSPLPLSRIVAIRLAAQIMSMLAALVFMTLLAAFMLDMDRAVLPVLAASLLLGIPTLVLIGGIMGAVTVGLRRHPAMLTLLLIPFYIPVLVFAIGACDAAAIGSSSAPHLLLLAALVALLAPISPFIIAAALRQGQG
jgi:heme exporter protein B